MVVEDEENFDFLSSSFSKIVGKALVAGAWDPAAMSDEDAGIYRWITSASYDLYSQEDDQ